MSGSFYNAATKSLSCSYALPSFSKSVARVAYNEASRLLSTYSVSSSMAMEMSAIALTTSSSFVRTDERKMSALTSVGLAVNATVSK